MFPRSSVIHCSCFSRVIFFMFLCLTISDAIKSSVITFPCYDKTSTSQLKLRDSILMDFISIRILYSSKRLLPPSQAWRISIQHIHDFRPSSAPNSAAYSRDKWKWPIGSQLELDSTQLGSDWNAITFLMYKAVDSSSRMHLSLHISFSSNFASTTYNVLRATDTNESLTVVMGRNSN